MPNTCKLEPPTPGKHRQQAAPNSNQQSNLQEATVSTLCGGTSPDKLMIANFLHITNRHNNAIPSMPNFKRGAGTSRRSFFLSAGSFCGGGGGSEKNHPSWALNPRTCSKAIYSSRVHYPGQANTYSPFNYLLITQSRLLSYQASTKCQIMDVICINFG